MIGFRQKNCLPGVVVGVLLAVFLTACTTLQPAAPPASEKTAPAPYQQPGSEAAEPQPVADSGAGEQLSSSLLYDILLGEIAGQRGHLDVSVGAYVKAARHSRDARVAERALKIAVYAKNQELALEAARRWVELAPDNKEARQSLAALALRSGHEDEALAQIEYLIQRGEEAPNQTYQALLGLLVREPDKQQTLALMEKLVARHPEDPDAHFAYARLATHAESWEVAGREVDTALRLRPDWVPALVLRAQIQFRQGKKQLAHEQMRAALERMPGNMELRAAYARLLVDLDDLDGARRQYERLVKKQPDNGQVVYSLALLSLEAGKLDAAERHFKHLLKLGYQVQQAYYYLGAIAEERNDIEGATEWYNRVGKGDHWLEVQIRLAKLEADSGKVKDARERLHRLRRVQPQHAQRLLLVEGDILSSIDWHEEAFTLYSQYLDIHPDDADVLYARALVAERLDRLDIAEQDLLRILKADPDNARALNALGYTLADRTDRYQEALLYIQQAMEKTPDDAAVIDSMGWVQFRLGNLEKAREYLQRAYAMSKDAEIAAHLGEVLWTMGHKQAARRVWDEARRKTPGNRILEDTVRRLAH